MRRERCGAGLPAQANYAPEVTVPDPPPVAGQPGHDRTVRQRDWLTPAFGVVLRGQERHGVGLDALELDPARSGVHRVGTPRTLERGAVAREVLDRGTNQLHTVIVTGRSSEFSDASGGQGPRPGTKVTRLPFRPYRLQWQRPA